MIDHLSLMDIQRWRLRKIPETVSTETFGLKQNVKNSDLTCSPEAKKNVRSIESVEIDQEASMPSLVAEDVAFSAYAATSDRVDNIGNKSRWLWVVPQSSLPSNELKLLDKIVSATNSSWESSGVADNYCNEQQLNNVLKTSLSVIVVFGEITDDVWVNFFNHDLYVDQKFFIGTSLQEMIKEPDKKRVVWQSLQGLMLGD